MQVAKVIDHITQWLSEYADGAGTKLFVVGVSGGIDSAVTSALAARTGRPVLLVEMPIHQDPAQATRARKHIEQQEAVHSNVRSVQVDLTPVFDQFVASLPAGGNDETRELSLANARARLRMTTLYYFAGLEGGLVVGTGNKVEDFGVGFFTKYGDGGVDVSPIADLLKSEVYRLGDELGVLDDIMNAPPTDGLWGDNRTDEAQLGASYAELEAAMAFEGEATLSKREREVLTLYRRLHEANRHKMEPIPVCDIPDELKTEDSST